MTLTGGLDSLSLSFHGVPDDIWRFLLTVTTCGLLVIGLSGLSPLRATSFVDIYHTLTRSMAKLKVGNEGSLRGKDVSRFLNLLACDVPSNKR